MGNNLSGLAGMAALAGVNMGNLVPSILVKKEYKCLLPGCEKMTVHNGGYCSAEHCKEHRVMLRGK